MQETTRKYWRRCSTCKAEIDFGAGFWVCNVSTCNRKRTGLVFCTVECWDAHVPMMNHRESWAEERKAPMHAEAEAEDSVSGGVRRAAASPGKSSSNTSSPFPSMTMGKTAAPAERRIVRPGASDSEAKEVLVIASRLKEYVRVKSEMNTSDRVLEVLSDILRSICSEAIERARAEGRKTILDRDITFPGS